jgi:predicted double-glycine peptidase
MYSNENNFARRDEFLRWRMSLLYPQALTGAILSPFSTPSWGRANLCFLVFLAIVSCLLSSPAEARRPVRSLAEFRHESVIIQKWKFSCGAAALATLLTHDFEDPVTEHTVASSMLRHTDPSKVRAEEGFSLLALQEYAERRGYEASAYGQLSPQELLALVPAIVPVRFRGIDHFIVVRGLQAGEVLFADPAFGRRTLPLPEFERAWEQKIAFVIARRS